MEIYIFGILLGLVGLLLHWLKKKSRGEISDNLINYICVHPDRTLYSVSGMIISVVTLISSGHVDIENPATITSFIMAGYCLDSIANKGSIK